MTHKEFIKTRNERIYHRFTVENKRQKTIADEEGISESQVKHIIGAIRKAQNDQTNRAEVPRAHPG